MSAPKDRLTGRIFEELLLHRAKKLEEEGVLTLGRYGVQMSMFRDPLNPGQMKIQPMRSYPDFEGCIAPSGKQIIIEAKVTSGASYPLYKNHAERPRQIEHLMRRSRFGCLAYLILHFNERVLLRKTEEAATYAFRIHPDDHFIREFEAQERKSLTRADAELHGVKIPWNLWSTRATKLTPDLTVLLPKDAPLVKEPNLL